MARIGTTKSRKPVKLAWAERQRNELDAILDAAMEARTPWSPRRERISAGGGGTEHKLMRGLRTDQMTDRRRNGERRKGEKMTPFDIAWAIERWIAGETQMQIAKSLGYADGSSVSTDIGPPC